MADLGIDPRGSTAFGPTKASAPDKTLAQSLEDTYFAGAKPSQDELLGFRKTVGDLISSGYKDWQLETALQNAKQQNFDFAGQLGQDYYQNKLAQQITNQRNSLGTDKYYQEAGAFGGIDAATKYMADRLVLSGIRDISEIGERTQKSSQPDYSNMPQALQDFQDWYKSGGWSGQEANSFVDYKGKKYFYTNALVGSGVNFEGGGENYYEPALVPMNPIGEQEKVLYNKRTGEQLKQGHDVGYIYANTSISPDNPNARYTIGGTFGGNNAGMHVAMVDGIPVFYTATGPSSSFISKEGVGVALAMASLMVPQLSIAIGSTITGALGVAASSAVAGAIGTGVLTAIANNGDIKKGVIAGLTSFLVPKFAGGIAEVAPEVAGQLGDAAKGLFESPAGKKLVEGVSSAAMRAAALGGNAQDIEQAVLGATAGELFNVVTQNLPGFSSLIDSKEKAAIMSVVQDALSAPGGFGEKLKNATLNGAVTLGLGQFELDGKKFSDLAPNQQAVVRAALTTALSGNPLTDPKIISEILSASNREVAAELKKTPAAQPEDFGYQPNLDVQPMIGDVGFLPGLSNIPSLSARAPQQLQVDPLTGEVAFAPSVIPSFGVDLTTGLPTSSPFIGGAPEGLMGPQIPQRIPTLDPQQGIVSDVSPPIRREELLTDPTRPARELAPGSIPGEVPMRRDYPDADKQAKTREEISDDVYKQLVENFENANPSTLRAAADLALDYSSFDPNIPTPMSDAAEQNKSLIAQGVADAYKQLTVATPILLKLQTDALQVDKAQKWLSRYDLVDEGKLNEAFAQINKGDQYDQRILSEYSRATPEQRAEIRDRQNGVIQSSTGAAVEAIKLYEQFKKDRQDQNIRVPEFTDIRTDNIKNLAEDFSKWLQYNVGAGSVSTATVMLGALIGGPVGALAVSTPMATGEALANRMQYLSEVYKGKSPDETASSILEYLNKTGETSLIVGSISGALDLMGPVGTALRRQATNSLVREVIERPVVGALKNVSKEMVEEAFTGAMQELTQIFGEQRLGEQEGPLFSVENAKRIVNSAAAEAAGSLGGSGVNLATASGSQQWKDKTIEIAKQHAQDEVAAGRVLYPDLQNPQTPQEAAQYRQALDRLSDPTTSRSVTEFDLYGSGFSEVPINKPEFGVKSSTQTLDGQTLYNLGDGYAALEDAFGGIKVLNEEGNIVPLSVQDLTELYDVIITPYKQAQEAASANRPEPSVVTSPVDKPSDLGTVSTDQRPTIPSDQKPSDATPTDQIPTDISKDGTVVTTPPSDVVVPNTTGRVTNPDAVTAMDMALGKVPVDLRFDLDGDGVVTAADVLAISRGAKVPAAATPENVSTTPVVTTPVVTTPIETDAQRIAREAAEAEALDRAKYEDFYTDIFPDFATYKAYKGNADAYRADQAAKRSEDASRLGFPNIQTFDYYKGDINRFHQDEAEYLGFPDVGTYLEYKGDFKAYDDARASAEGWPDASTRDEFNNDKARYAKHLADERALAEQGRAYEERQRQIAKFPDYGTFEKFGGDFDAYQRSLAASTGTQGTGSTADSSASTATSTATGSAPTGAGTIDTTAGGTSGTATGTSAAASDSATGTATGSTAVSGTGTTSTATNVATGPTSTAGGSGTIDVTAGGTGGTSGAASGTGTAGGDSATGTAAGSTSIGTATGTATGSTSTGGAATVVTPGGATDTTGTPVVTQPSGSQLTEQDITRIVSNINFPPSLSREDVGGIVRTVMAENPGLSREDVRIAINTAFSALPPSASPADVNRVVASTVGSPSVVDNPNTVENESRPATGIYSVIETYQGEAAKQAKDLEKRIADLTKAQEDRLRAEEEQRVQAEAQRKLDEEAKKQAEEASRRGTLLNLGTSMLGGAAGAGILGGLSSVAATPAPLSPLKGLTTGEASNEFVSPLAAFQKQIGLVQPEQETKPEERTMPYFSYGQPSEVASVLSLDEEDQMAAKGGLMTPLMASGGLPVVHYAGKPRMDYRQGAYVQGPGDGQSDDIPAMLADGEYVFDAETVAALGNGSNKAGAKLLDKMREQIRAHKRGGSLKKIPPASKSPLEYLAMVKR